MIERFLSRFTSEQKLLYSIIYGWGMLFIFLAILPLWVWITEGIDPLETMMLGFWGAAIFLSLRYSLMNPVLRVVSGGAKVIGITYVFGLIFDRRNSGSMAYGALLGALFILVLVLLKNAIISMYYLIKETYTFVTVKKGTPLGMEPF